MASTQNRFFTSLRMTATVGITVLAVFALGAKTASASSLHKSPNNLGLVGYWSFEDATGTKATDFSGNGHTGTLTNGPTWTGGKIGKALLFEYGSTKFVRITNFTPALDGTFDVTVSAWFYRTISSVNSGIFAQRGTPSGSGSAFYIDGTDKLAVYDAGGSGVLNGSTNTVSLNQWHHAVWVKSGATLTYYLDGALDGSEAISTSGWSPSADASIGAWSDGGFAPFPGVIDEVRLYSRALSAGEVTALYSSSLGSKLNASQNTRGPQNGLIGEWSFDNQDVSGTTAYDRSGQGINGTLANGPTPVRGKIGQALHFDGVDDEVTIGGGTFTSLLTISVWVKSDTTPTNEAIVSSYGSTFMVGFYGSSLAWINNGGLSSQIGTTGTYPDTTNWHHVVFTADGTNLNIYYDGALVKSAAGTITTPGVFNRIGSNQSYYFNGSIDDVRIYNRALSAAEVSQLYHVGQTTVDTSRVGGAGSGNLVLWQTFDGPKLNATTSTDSSGQGNNGTLVGGPTPVRGKIGQGLSFDGVDDQVQTTNQFTNTSFSYAGWFKTSATSAGMILGAYNTKDASSIAFGSYAIYLGNDGKLHQREYPGTEINIASASTYNDGNWHHFAVAFDNNSQLINVYFDGSLFGTNNNGFNNYANYWVIGAGDLTGLTSANSGVNYFHGLIDDIRVYNKALSASEILQLYNAGK